MISAEYAMEQAWKTAHEYFISLTETVENAYPKAPAAAKLAAVVELCKVAAQDFHSWQIGNVAEATMARFSTIAEELDGRLHGIEQSLDMIDGTLTKTL